MTTLKIKPPDWPGGIPRKMKSKVESSVIKAASVLCFLNYGQRRDRVTTCEIMVPAGGIEPSSPRQGNKLLIFVYDKTRRNAGNAEVRYTVGTWDMTGR